MHSNEHGSTLRILKHGTCQSLSGKSVLGYSVSHDPADGGIGIQLTSNSGGGKFNTDWISLAKIDALIAEYADRKTLHTPMLRCLFPGKSTNSPAFLLAVLRAEGIVGSGPDRDGGYLIHDTASFHTAMTTAITETENPQGAATISKRPSRQKHGSKEKA